VHHVMVRHTSRRAIFRDDHDREDLVASLAALAHDRRLAVYAWALMSNHFHLLVRTVNVSLESSMRSLLACFAAAIARREGAARRVPDRYQSNVCKAGRHFLEIVRYIHLNPFRGGIVRHVDELDDYPYTGHSALMATVPRDWQSTEEVLECFGSSAGWARAAYRKFVCEGALARGARRKRWRT
jgi:putative transposase